MKTHFLRIFPRWALLMIVAIGLPQLVAAQDAISSGRVVYEGVVLDSSSHKPWCTGEVFVMKGHRIKARDFVDEDGKFLLEISSTLASKRRLRIVAELTCNPYGHGRSRHCVAERSAPDRSSLDLKFVVGGGCGACSCI